MYLFYDQDGRITGRTDPHPRPSPEEFAEWHAGKTMVEVDRDTPFDYATHWIDGGVLAERQPLNVSWDKTTIDADGIDYATLSGLPNPCPVSVDGLIGDLVTDTTFEFDTVDPGFYRIKVDLPGYLVEEWIIDAT